MHSDGSMDIQLEQGTYGIKFSVPARIVHEVEASAQFQSGINGLMPLEK